jgi:hypothetical protein
MVPALPRTALNKVLRAKLREELAGREPAVRELAVRELAVREPAGTAGRASSQRSPAAGERE